MAKLNGIQKIAVLLAVVNRECAARLLRVFDGDEQQRIAQAVLELENLDLSMDAMKEIVDEFRTLLQTGGSAVPNVEKTLAELAPTLGDVLGAGRCRAHALRENAALADGEFAVEDAVFAERETPTEA